MISQKLPSRKARIDEAGAQVGEQYRRVLSLQGMLAKIPEEMPRRVVDPASKYTRALEALAAGYRKWAAKLRADEGDPSPLE